MTCMNSRNAKTIDDCYSAVLFVHMLAATFQLCFESFQVFTVSKIIYFSYSYAKEKFNTPYIKYFNFLI